MKRDRGTGHQARGERSTHGRTARSLSADNKLGISLAAGLALGAGIRWALRRRRRFEFRDRSVVITGGSRGLGLVLAREFAAEGAHLTLLARDGAELARARSELASRGANVMTIPCDVRRQEEVERTIQQVIASRGRIDVLINNAGVIQVGPLEHMSLRDFEDAMDVHLWGSLHAMFATIPHMRELRSGRIVNISSIGGRIAVPHLAPYTTSKFALVGLSESMRTELKKDNILVTTVCPSLIRTGSPVHAEFKGRSEEEFAWFSISDSLPVISVSAERAARRIIRACRYGDPSPSISVSGRLLTVFGALFPGMSSELLELINRLLPREAGEESAEGKSGLESQSRWAPSLLTRLSDAAAKRNNQLPN